MGSKHKIIPIKILFYLLSLCHSTDCKKDALNSSWHHLHEGMQGVGAQYQFIWISLLPYSKDTKQISLLCD